jgi:hypothetical protein
VLPFPLGQDVTAASVELQAALHEQHRPQRMPRGYRCSTCGQLDRTIKRDAIFR